MKKPVSDTFDSKDVNPMTLERHRHGAIATFLGTVAVVALAQACGPKGATLTVEVNAPPGIEPEIIVNGPGSFMTTIHGTTTLEDVPPGDYAVRIVDRRARVAHPVIDSIVAGSVTGSPVTLGTEGGAKVDVRFDKEPGSGRVWIPAAREDRILSFTGDELTQDGAPSIELEMPAKSQPDAAAIDARGNLWVSLRGAGQVARIAATSLGSSGAPSIDAKIAIEQPRGIAFGEGDLWVASASKKQIVRWGNTLEASPTRRTDITVEGTPQGIAFDAKGNLLVATTEPAALVMFAVEALAMPKPAPSRIVKGPESKLVAPGALAVDANGAVWVTNEEGQAVRFDRAALDAVAGEADLAPSAVLAAAGGASLDGLAFDNAGAGWLAAVQGGSNRHELAKAVDMQSPSPVIVGGRDLMVSGPRTPGRLAMPAFDPPSRVLPMRR